MSNVVALNPDAPKPLTDGVNEELIEILERQLNDAREGRLLAAAYVITFVDKRTRTGWSNTIDTDDAIGAGILTLMHRYGAAAAPPVDD